MVMFSSSSSVAPLGRKQRWRHLLLRTAVAIITFFVGMVPLLYHDKSYEMPQAAMSTAAITIAMATKPIKNTTRSKVHWCFWKPHMYTPMRMLQQEFGYTEEIDPRKVEELMSGI
jgi:uncharacterized membrane protein YfcA